MNYKCIYSDPPWSFKSKRTGGSMKSGALNHYDTMSIESLSLLNVGDLCDENCLLVMWWVASQPQEAIELCHAWGFRLCTMTGFVWNKKTKLGNDYFGLGHTTRASVECALIGYRGKLKNIIKSHSVRSIQTANVGLHSQKPKIIKDKIDELVGDVPKLEMFARINTPGWDVFGDEVGNSIHIPRKNLTY